MPLSRDPAAADPSQAQKSMPSDGVVVAVVVVVVSGSSLYTELASHSVSSSSSRQNESRYAWREMSGRESALVARAREKAMGDQLLSGMSLSSSVFLKRAESRRRIDFLPEEAGVHVSCQMVRSSSDTPPLGPLAPALHEIQ